MPTMRLALVLPPLTQLNTPYPSISYLARFLAEREISCTQRDLGIELVLGLFSVAGLREVFDTINQLESVPEPAWRFVSLAEQHVRVIDPVIHFLQGREDTLASRILDTPFLPVGPRLAQADLDAFGPMGTVDAARHLATLYIDDLADLITTCVDPGFGLARYQAHLATGAVSFDPIEKRLAETTLIDRRLDRLADTIEADAVGLSVPFPGNLYGALRIGRRLKARGVPVWMGGGYVTTELREIDEPRIWSCVDALTLDDGEGPLLALLEHLEGKGDRRHRTLTANGTHDGATTGFPVGCAADYGDLDLGLYLQTIDTLNPAHRLWADGRWNKITIAHGCYWKRCTFCDIGLDYIAHYEDAETTRLVDEIERLVAETGSTGFHFVDEAAPPKALKALALELLRRNLGVTLWGNIRFEKAFTPDLCRLLAAAGVVAVTGGLEVANARLLQAMDKGVTVEQVARAAAAFRAAGVMVHAYLMYGFPTESEQETIDSMELVRQLFAADLVNSAFWHRFVLTRHAPMFERAAEFGIELARDDDSDNRFTGNDIAHLDPSGGNHDEFDTALPIALEAWMQGRGFDVPVEEWFETDMPTTTEPSDRIARGLAPHTPSSATRLVWLGGEPLPIPGGLMLHTADAELRVAGRAPDLQWLAQTLERAHPSKPPLTLREALRSFPSDFRSFQKTWDQVCELGLLVV